MARLEVRHELGPDDIAAVTRLLEVAMETDGHAPLGEHRWLDTVGLGTGGAGTVGLGTGGASTVGLGTGGAGTVGLGTGGAGVQGGRRGFAGVVVLEEGHDHPLAYAHVTRASAVRAANWAVEFVVDPHHRDAMPRIGRVLVDAALDVVRHEGGGHVHLWVPKPGPAHDEIATSVGLRRGRELRQLRRSLPVDGAKVAIALRQFRVGEDEEAWLEVNNRAFRGHPEQGGWDLETLSRREEQPWFDPSGFLLHERDGRLAGFCWTKVHRHSDPPLGEIYVIAVDPDFQGLGLGRSLTVAGLEHLAGRGLGQAMLYVDGDNAAALHLYGRLGFTVDHLHRAYVGDIPPSQPNPPSRPTTEPTA